MPNFSSTLFKATISVSTNSYEILLTTQDSNRSAVQVQYSRIPMSSSTPKIGQQNKEKNQGRKNIPPKKESKDPHHRFSEHSKQERQSIKSHRLHSSRCQNML